MGEAAKADDHIPVSAGDINSAGIAELLKQRQCLVLHHQLFCVHQRHQPELPPRLRRFGRHPAQLHRLLTQGKRLGITRKSHGGVAPDLPRELIQQQHQRQGTAWLSTPGIEFAGDRLPGQSEKALPQQVVKGSVLGEPLLRSGFGKPELENLAGLVPRTIHQSRACTLATLSSRVCSLSVRVLIFTVV